MNTTGEAVAPLSANRFYEPVSVYGSPLGAVSEGSRNNVMEVAHEKGLDFTVETRPLYRYDNVNDRYIEHATKHETFNGDTGVPFGVVGKDYGIMQNAVIVRTLQDMIDEGYMRLEAVYNLNGGRQQMFVAQLNGEHKIIEGDTVRSMVTWINSHDGSTSFLAVPHNIRMICANTMNSVISRSRSGFSIKHTASITNRAQAASNIIKEASNNFEHSVIQAKQLASRKFSAIDWATFLKHSFPEPVDMRDKEAIEKRLSPRHSRWMSACADVDRLYKHDVNCNLPGMNRSAWAAVNAVSAYYDHIKSDRGENAVSRHDPMMVSRIRGESAKQKNVAWDIAMASLDSKKWKEMGPQSNPSFFSMN